MTPLRVVVVERQSDTHAVVEAVLGREGLAVERWPAHRLANSAEARRQGDVMVVDLDDAAAPLEAHGSAYGPRSIFIGSAAHKAVGGSRFLAKPFEYPQLIGHLRDLLDLPPAA